ncbi:MAG: hypothetical protein AB7U29_06590 [Desulfobulbus sp.]
MYASKRFQTWYNGSPKEKLSQAQILLEHLRQKKMLDTALLKEIEFLRSGCLRLAAQMVDMALGRLCGSCASRPDGGCCSAYMADNTDSIQILINLLLGMEIVRREPNDSDCCFLGSMGCLFMAKPIFCLNYNCIHIVTGSDSAALALLEQLAAAVLSQQTRIETIVLERLLHCND